MKTFGNEVGIMTASEWNAFKQGFVIGFTSPIALLKNLFDRMREGAGRI